MQKKTTGRTYALLGELVHALLGVTATQLHDIEQTLLIRGKATDLTDHLTDEGDTLAEFLE